jgi:hypothetical protein
LPITNSPCLPQTYFFTDDSSGADAASLGIADGHLVATNCSATHARTALACKTATEFDHFLKSDKRLVQAEFFSGF